MNLDEALQTFIVESRELLADMESALLTLGDVADPSEAVNAIFRAAHTIKGSAGLFGLDHIVAFTHVVESVLDRVREGEVATDDTLVTLLLACGDHLGSLIGALAAGQTEASDESTARGQPLLARLQPYLGAAATAAQPAAPVQAATAAGPVDDGAPTGADHWHLSLRFGKDVLRNGMDPLSFLRYLNKLGTITHAVTLVDALPLLKEMDAESSYLGFEIALQSQADRATIDATFEFVREDCSVRIVAPRSRIEAYVALIQDSGEEPARLGEMLVRCGSLTAHEFAVAQQRQKSSPALLRQVRAQEPTGQQRDGKIEESQSIRVDAQKLDDLINLVGELITAGASASLAARRSANAEVQEANSYLASLVEQVRDSALQLRMVKIGGAFSRFRRVVHDVARELGKNIELSLKGEDTELDKTVVEKIGDPLTHLVRNAMDHGIETAQVRTACGKPAHGTVTLNAFHDSGSIVIEVSDDGGGLHRDKIMAKALERGLVEPGRALTDSEIYGLIFEPGFSTAEAVTNLSGRGVGMDVVKRNIVALRGNVDVTSEVGVGTTVTLRLPLTLAIINGFQVTVGKSVFVVPLEMIDECIAYTAQSASDFLDLRGQVMPLIRLREHLGVAGSGSGRQNIVVVRHAGQRYGLVVDSLLGEAQTVIKPMAKMFSIVQGISGSSILGNGDVALIIDVPPLIDQAARSGQAKSHAEDRNFESLRPAAQDT